MFKSRLTIQVALHCYSIQPFNFSQNRSEWEMTLLAISASLHAAPEICSARKSPAGAVEHSLLAAFSAALFCIGRGQTFKAQTIFFSSTLCGLTCRLLTPCVCVCVCVCACACVCVEVYRPWSLRTLHVGVCVCRCLYVYMYRYVCVSIYYILYRWMFVCERVYIVVCTWCVGGYVYTCVCVRCVRMYIGVCVVCVCVCVCNKYKRWKPCKVCTSCIKSHGESVLYVSTNSVGGGGEEWRAGWDAAGETEHRQAPQHCESTIEGGGGGEQRKEKQEKNWSTNCFEFKKYWIDLS